MKCIHYVHPCKTVIATEPLQPPPPPPPGTALLGVCHDAPGFLLAPVSRYSSLAFVCLLDRGLPYEPHELPKNHRMTQQSHHWAHTVRKPKLKETRAPRMFIAAHCLFGFLTMAGSKPRYQLTDERIQKLWSMYTVLLKRTHLSQS